MATMYDWIGRGYTLTRQPDLRIAAMITEALGDVRSVVNVGAGGLAADRSVVESLTALNPLLEFIHFDSNIPSS